MIYKCAMYRNLLDTVSSLQMKAGDEIPWIYGFRLYGSKGGYTIEIQDKATGTLRLLEAE